MESEYTETTPELPADETPAEAPEPTSEPAAAPDDEGEDGKTHTEEEA